MRSTVQWVLLVLLGVNLWLEIAGPSDVKLETKEQKQPAPAVASPLPGSPAEALPVKLIEPPSAEFVNLSIVGGSVFDHRGIGYARGLLYPGVGVVESVSPDLITVRRWDGQFHYLQHVQVDAASLAFMSPGAKDKDKGKPDTENRKKPIDPGSGLL